MTTQDYIDSLIRQQEACLNLAGPASGYSPEDKFDKLFERIFSKQVEILEEEIQILRRKILIDNTD